MKSVKVMALGAAVLALASCARYALVEPQTRVVDGTLQLTPTERWSRVANPAAGDIGAPELWTVEGEALHALVIVPGVADGKPLFHPTGGADKLPAFRTAMPPEEIASLFEATLTTVTASSLFRYTKVEPATVMGRPGLHMEFTYTGQDEVDRKGLAVAAVADGRLYLIAYQGTALYHYDKHLPEVRSILSSAVIRG
ncbi:hypothetical protein [Azospirillum sp. ST 5-10]|uniref:hypothetical protein n=1 Tax=unclassified Azospirillum TaxID=2630922 RepID=UPI003F4A0428